MPAAAMRRRHAATTALKILLALLGLAGVLGAVWWAVFALKPYTLSAGQLTALYAHDAAPAPALQLGPAERVTVGAAAAWAQSLGFASFDGAWVVGRIVHPADPAQAAPVRRPVLLALHGMGRTHWRWWQASFKGRPTLENTHLLAELALQAGHVVVALDARGHGERKDAERPLIARELMRRLHLWGEREPYERMIVDTVKDYRVLLDALAQQPLLEAGRVRAAGYSMGAQMALLLAGVDARVHSVAAMVPPHLGCTVAAVAPLTVAARLTHTGVWLLTADDDEYASRRHNQALFAALPGGQKQHLRFDGGHVLPARWVQTLQPWLQSPAPPPVNALASVGPWPPAPGAAAPSVGARCSRS
jgi:dienelactone hydrolase